MNKRGIALILIFMVITVLSILSVAVLSRSISESNITQKHLESTQCFWLAEAAANQALSQLRIGTNYGTLASIPVTALGQGEYSADITAVGPNRLVASHGFIPSQSQPRIQRDIDVIIGDPFYTNAIYALGDVQVNGTSYGINGNLRYGGTINITMPPQPANITGTVTRDTAMRTLNLTSLRSTSSNQGYLNVPEANFPATFANTAIPYPGAPNVVYLERNLSLNNTTLRGFFIVIGNVTVNGNVQVDGGLYVQGNITVNGTGDLTGAIWTEGNIRINGNGSVTYNEGRLGEMQTLLTTLGFPLNLRVLYYKDQNNPYPLSP